MAETCRMAMSTSMPEIIVQEEGSKRIVTLNRPKALNALNLSMIREIYPQFKKWEDGGDVSMIILKGSGEKAFCAGGDVLAVTRSAKEAASGGTSTIHKDFFREEYRLNHLIGINGRFRVGTERTLLAMPETALGLFPDVLLSKVDSSYEICCDSILSVQDNLGLYLALTGYRLHGADAYHAGLATHYVTSSKLKDLQNKLLTMERVTYNEVDAVIREFQPSNIPTFSLEEHLPVIKKTFYAKSVGEIFENLRAENSEWSKEQLKTLSKMSPTSLKVTFKQLENGGKMKFDEVSHYMELFKCGIHS
uniref:3-hydroxyisobutyryl-CoA hydrolase, mitochondrial n=1 Tax=Angiostrongylus cantonensis TaxID=6313 RepID=A0A0K0DJF2_ANGCA